MTDNLTTRFTAVRFSSDDEQQRLTQILDEYLLSLEGSEPVAPEVILGPRPEIADRMSAFLKSLRRVHYAVADSTASTVVERDHCVGWELGDFRIGQEIGRGGMGIVYEGVQISSGRRVALKVLPFATAVAEKQIARFKYESQAVAQINHPNIVPLFSIGQEYGIYYFATQLIQGKSLGRLLAELRSAAMFREPELVSRFASAKGTRLHIRRIAEMGIQIAEALHAAHQAGIVHRDIKPSNLLLDENKKVWITDFGVALCKSNVSISEAGYASAYMSPEQVNAGSVHADYRSDIYSLGVTLYELATLQHPFENFPYSALDIEFGRANLRRLRHWNNAIPVDYENIILKAMSENPVERYATAGELADDLRRFIAGEPVLARQPSWGVRLGNWAKRLLDPTHCC